MYKFCTTSIDKKINKEEKDRDKLKIRKLAPSLECQNTYKYEE